MSDTLKETASRKTSNRWTQTDTDYLIANASKGALVLATELGRSATDVRAKATRLGISLRMPGSTRGRRTKTETTVTGTN